MLCVVYSISRDLGKFPEVWNYLRLMLARKGQTYAGYMAEREANKLLETRGETFDDEPAVVSIMEDWEDHAEQESQVRHIQSTLSTLSACRTGKIQSIPAMPVVSEPEVQNHRPKLRNHSPFQEAMVARSVGRSETLSNEAALKAVHKE